MLESVIYSNSVFHICLKSKGAFLIKINGEKYSVKEIYALNSFESEITLKIEIIGVYKSITKDLRVPITRLKTDVPFAKLNQDFEIKEPFSIGAFKKIENLELGLSSLDLNNKKIHLKSFYSKSKQYSKDLRVKKDLYQELENSLKKENI